MPRPSLFAQKWSFVYFIVLFDDRTLFFIKIDMIDIPFGTHSLIAM